jgi:hypothetical protein
LVDGWCNVSSSGTRPGFCQRSSTKSVNPVIPGTHWGGEVGRRSYPRTVQRSEDSELAPKLVGRFGVRHYHRLLRVGADILNPGSLSSTSSCDVASSTRSRLLHYEAHLESSSLELNSIIWRGEHYRARYVIKRMYVEPSSLDLNGILKRGEHHPPVPACACNFLMAAGYGPVSPHIPTSVWCDHVTTTQYTTQYDHSMWVSFIIISFYCLIKCVRATNTW